jgi:hypothetical protein
VQRPHHCDPCDHQVVAVLGDQNEKLERRLPFRGVVLCLRQLGDVEAASRSVTNWRLGGNGIGYSKGRFQPRSAISAPLAGSDA